MFDFAWDVCSLGATQRGCDVSHVNEGLPGKFGLHEVDHITLWDHSG